MIRPFQQSDMEHVLKIWLDASIESHGFMQSEFWVSKVADMREVYLPSAETFVYDMEGVVFGFISLFESTIAALFVSPDRQGQGIGTQLLNFVKNIRSELTLSVYKENPGSISFYKDRKFHVTSEQLDENTGHAEFQMKWIK